MNRKTCLAIVLAAGEGTRMRSAMPKVLHEIAGRSLLAHVLDAAKAAGANEIAVVASLAQGPVATEAKRVAANAQIFEQGERRGTAHAVLAAKPAIAHGHGDILVIFGD